LRQLLRTLPWSKTVGVGDVLARRWSLQLDYCTVDSGPGDDEGFASRPSRGARDLYFLGVLLRSALGSRRTHLWSDNAIPGIVTGDGRGPGTLCGVRNPDASDFSWCVHDSGPGNYLRPGNSAGYRCLPCWNCGSRTSWHVETACDVSAT